MFKHKQIGPIVLCFVAICAIIVFWAYLLEWERDYNIRRFKELNQALSLSSDPCLKTPIVILEDGSYINSHFVIVLGQQFKLGELQHIEFINDNIEKIHAYKTGVLCSPAR